MRTSDLYDQFVKQFFNETPKALTTDVAEMGRRLFFDPQRSHPFVEKQKLQVHSVGQYLGEAKASFQPTPFCIERIGALAKEEQKVVLDEKGSWLFLCGRDVFGGAVKKGEPQKGKPVFVYDEEGRNLGFGEWTTNEIRKANSIAIKHKVDRGEYIRRK